MSLIKRWKSFLLLLFSTALVALAWECVVRNIFPEWAPRTGRITQFWQFDKELGWSHQAGISGNFDSFGFSTQVQINSAGFRDEEWSKNIPDRKQRVLVFGDSFVWGFGVEHEQTFLKRIEHRNPKLQPLNFGVSGYSTDQELLLYRKVKASFDYNAVMLVVAANDVPCNALSEVYLVYPKPMFELSPGSDGENLILSNVPLSPPPWHKKFVVDMASRSYIFNQLNRLRDEGNRNNILTLLSPAQTSIRVPDTQKQDPFSFPKTYAEKLTLRLLLQFQKEVQDEHKLFFVVFVDGMYAGDEYPQALRAASIPSLALNDFLDYQDPALHLPDQLHWTALGHEKVAAAVEPFLRDQLK